MADVRKFGQSNFYRLLAILRTFPQQKRATHTSGNTVISTRYGDIHQLRTSHGRRPASPKKLHETSHVSLHEATIAGHPGDERELVLHAPHRRRMPTGMEI
jgi:hypothetical protein